MLKNASLLTLLIAALIGSLPAVPARAQAARTFVSTAGSDSNNCASLATPCQHFQAAVNATASGGEVVALDPGKYGSFTISQAITIQGGGWSYVSPPNIAPPANGGAITVNANASDNIVIRGVSIDGNGANRANGIMFNSGGSLTVIDCVAQNFGWDGASVSGNGVLIVPTSGAISFVIKNTIVTNNGHAGIAFVASSGSTATGVTGEIDHVVAINSSLAGYGAFIVTSPGGVDPGGPSMTLAISNSVFNNNSQSGIYITNASSTPSPLTVSIDNTIVSANGGNGIEAHNSSNVILGRSVITANTGAGILNQTSSNTFYSYSDNRINGNGTDISGPLNYSRGAE